MHVDADDPETVKQRLLQIGSTVNKRVFRYRDRDVVIPEKAEVPYRFTPEGRGRRELQAVLDDKAIEWATTPHGTTCKTIKLDRLILMDVVTLRADVVGPVMWFQHGLHKAEHVEVSPFVVVDDDVLTDEVTAELRQTEGGEWLLVRAYAGGYRPPLPWQRSSIPNKPAYDEAVEYWREHAYIFGEPVVVPGSNAKRPPKWASA